MTASFFDDTIAWYENNGSQSFTKHVISDQEKGAYYAFPVDVDGDGDMDVYSASKSDNTIAWHRNDGSMGFTSIVITGGAKGARSVIAVDINGDGTPDALTTNKEDNEIAWYANDGSGGFSENFVDENAGGAYGTFAIDINHDGLIDVLSAARDSFELSVHRQGRSHLTRASQGDVLIIDSNLLSTVDPNNSPVQLTYTIAVAPAFGVLEVGGVPIGAGGTFTQAEVEAGLVGYNHDGVDRTSDAFVFDVSDGATSIHGSFAIDITGFAGTLVRLPLDEGSGVIAGDVSGVGNDGALINGAAFEGTTGDGSASAVRLDGNDDLIDIGVIDVDGVGLTLAGWFNADTYPGSSNDPRLISKASSSAANDHVFMLGMYNVGAEVRLRGRVRHAGSTTTVIATAGALDTGTWYHAALTDDGSQVRLYLDGVEVGSAAVSGPVDIAPLVGVVAGGQPPGAGGANFDGLVDDIRILSRPMSQAEISNIVDPGNPGNLAPSAFGDGYTTVENTNLTVSAVLGLAIYQ